MSTTTQKYLLIYRNPADQPPFQPSPAEMQQILAAWTAWRDRFKAEILDLGDALLPPGKVLRQGSQTDGPFIEAKEVLGGYSIVAARSLEHAVEISQGCPILAMPGGSIEVRPLAGFDMVRTDDK